MNVEISSLVMLILGTVFSAYASILVYHSKKNDIKVSTLETNISEMKSDARICMAKIANLEDNQLTTEKLESIIEKTVKASVETAFLRFENHLIKKENEKLVKKKVKNEV